MVLDIGVGVDDGSRDVMPITSARKEIFCEKYLETFSVRIASDTIGVSVNTGYKWLKEDEEVKSYIGLRRDQIASAAGIKQDWIVNNWVEILNRGMGRVVGYEHDHGVALKASELLAKNLGMFEQTLNINHNIIPQMVIERYDNADYREIDLIEHGKPAETAGIV